MVELFCIGFIGLTGLVMGLSISGLIGFKCSGPIAFKRFHVELPLELTEPGLTMVLGALPAVVLASASAGPGLTIVTLTLVLQFCHESFKNIAAVM
jgi:hypothetical protein